MSASVCPCECVRAGGRARVCVGGVRACVRACVRVGVCGCVGVLVDWFFGWLVVVSVCF